MRTLPLLLLATAACVPEVADPGASGWAPPAEVRVVADPAAGLTPATQRLHLDADGRALDLVLQRNDDLFAPTYREWRQHPDGRLEEVPAGERADAVGCWYTGRVEEAGVAVGVAGVRTCDGTDAAAVRGLLALDGGLYDLAPQGGDVHRLTAAPPLLPDLGGVETSVPPPEVRPAPAGLPERWGPPPTRWLELLVYNDFARTQALGAGTALDTALLVNAADAVYEAASLAEPLQVVLSGQRLWTAGDPIVPSITDGEVDSAALLTDFNAWVQGSDPTAPSHDVRHLFSHLDFPEDSFGLAYTNAVCTSSRSGVLQVDRSVAFTTAVIAHELGHALRMIHDGTSRATNPTEDATACPTTGFLMAGINAFAQPSTTLSSCSLEAYAHLLGTSRGDCLLARPSLAGGTCGDGVLDREEECDCGPGGCVGVDPCCDGSTCRLQAGASCSALDPCCDGTCQPRDNGAVCEDAWGGDGACYLGTCVGLEAQCREIALQSDPVYLHDDACQAVTDQRGAACTELTCGKETDASCYTFLQPGNTTAAPLDGSPCPSGQCVAGDCVPSGSIPPVPRCGDGILQPDRGETCDDGNTELKDGCDLCVLQDLWVFRPQPGQAGVENTVLVQGATPGEVVSLAFGLRPGTFDLPPCPGLRLPFEGARLAASGVAGDDGRVLLSMTPPAWAAGNVAGFVPVELGTCRQGNLVVSGF
ncbi:MAG: DUF4215 domain-containing protein [Alphaproteobacteria bacterium]|nr:DUF4215 domain-containing protein [Alphaproteobacteria bacterium]